ncbi:hypothetical protein BC940DRAFT_289537, partial [Gongronella butleri]
NSQMRQCMTPPMYRQHPPPALSISSMSSGASSPQLPSPKDSGSPQEFTAWPTYAPIEQKTRQSNPASARKKSASNVPMPLPSPAPSPAAQGIPNAPDFYTVPASEAILSPPTPQSPWNDDKVDDDNDNHEKEQGRPFGVPPSQAALSASARNAVEQAEPASSAPEWSLQEPLLSRPTRYHANTFDLPGDLASAKMRWGDSELAVELAEDLILPIDKPTLKTRWRRWCAKPHSFFCIPWSLR